LTWALHVVYWSDRVHPAGEDVHMAGSAIVRPSAVIVVSALLVALTTPVRGQVADNKTYTVHVTASVDAGDADAVIVLTITNTAENQDLGSANVVVPEPFVVGGVSVADDEADADLSAPALIELRDLGLAPDASVDVTIVVDVQTCVPLTPDAFDVAAKQSNTFKGTGNDFFLETGESGLTAGIDGTCGLAFAAQPGDAERGAVITTVDHEPDGDPIAVEVVDAGDAEPATHATPTVALSAANDAVGDPTLGGTTTATAVAGLARFDPGPTLAPSAFDYALGATADFDGDGTADASTTSDPFDIVDEQVTCPAGIACPSATARRGGQEVTVTLDGVASGSRATSLVVSLGAADVPDFDCEGVPTDRVTAQYFLTRGDDTDRTGTLSLTIPDAVQPVKAYEVCWAAPYDFATDDGQGSTAQGTKPSDDGATTALQVGVLPDCARRGEPARPCVADRSLDQRSSTATIDVLVDGRDPWARS
jgi:hypothetical protein